MIVLKTLRTLLVASALLLLALPASALDLTQRQVAVSGKIDVSSAAKIASKLLEFDSAATAPIYLMITATDGSAQGVLLLADTVRSLESPVVGVVVTQVHGAGAALAPFTDRVYIYPSSGLVFTEVDYEGVKKPAPPKEEKAPEEGAEAAPPKEVKPVEPGEQLLQQARTAYLERFWERLARRIYLKPATLTARIDEGGFIMTPKEAVDAKVAHSVVERITFTKLAEVKREVKTVTTESRDRTVDPPSRELRQSPKRH